MFLGLMLVGFLLASLFHTRPALVAFLAMDRAHDAAQKFYWGNFKRIAAVYFTVAALYGVIA